MNWRYTLIDRYDNSTVIDEPNGWSGFTIRTKRHRERHGTFRELQGNRFQFFGIAMQLLRKEYELYGVRSKYDMLIEMSCDGGYEEFYRGAVSFDKYTFNDGPACSVSADLDQTGPQVNFINRFDQKVNVTKSIAFDGTTPLIDYPRLTRTILLPSKTILLRGQSKNVASHEYIISGDSGWIFAAGTGLLQGTIVPVFDTTDVNTIKTYTPQTILDFYNKTHLNEDVPELIFNEPNQDLNCTGVTYHVNFRMKGRYKHLNAGSGTQTLNAVLKTGSNTFYAGATVIDSWNIFDPFSTQNMDVATYEFDFTYSGTITLNPGEKLWLGFFLSYTKFTNFTADVRIEFDAETFFKADVESKCDPSTAKLYMINETTSRVAEAITNNGLRLYSQSLGRTDSQPYSFPSMGCESLRALTTGLEIRKQKQADGSDPDMFLSMKDIFDALSAIDNIGLGFEGTDRIRIENWKWFYKSTVIMTCRNIDLIEKATQTDEHISIFKNGYSKWEAEDYNGLDEFLTKREFRTSLGEVQNTLDKICNFISSGYASEVTRRKQGSDKDWRYDNDTFIFALTNKLRASSGFSSSLGLIILPVTDFFVDGHTIRITNTAFNNRDFTITGIAIVFFFMFVIVAEPLTDETDVEAIYEDITDEQYKIEINNIYNAANLVDPSTVYNFRLSPVRNAMKWFDRISAGYRHVSGDDKLFFSAGEGNYIAEGELKESFCKKESGVIKENTDIGFSSFAVPASARPIAFADRVKYKFPLSANEYKKMMAFPYGLVEYEGQAEKGQGWIDELEYTPEDGIAKFTLIPKINY
jgi:hypothetical protein